MSVNIKYDKEHLWVKADAAEAVIGVTDYGQELLGEIIFVELPDTGGAIECGQVLCVVESLKTVTEINAPCQGQIVEVNEALLGSPELINKDPDNDGWLVKVRYVSLKEDLMTPEEYEIYIND